MYEMDNICLVNYIAYTLTLGLISLYNEIYVVKIYSLLYDNYSLNTLHLRCCKYYAKFSCSMQPLNNLA